MIRAAVLALLGATAIFGQSDAAPLKFEVASIKPTPPSVDGGYRIRARNDPGRLDYSAFSLQAIIQRAYNVAGFQISGPDWLASTRFDLAAKLPEGAPRSAVPEMLRSLLAERFHLATHRETREMPGYALTVNKSGIRMKEAEVDTGAPAGWMINKGPGHIQGHAMTTAGITNLLAFQLGRFVVDRTGLKGNFDFDLEFAAEETSGAAANTDVLPLLLAVQSQLGLKLEATRGPVEIIVVDRVEKTPAGN